MVNTDYPYSFISLKIFKENSQSSLVTYYMPKTVRNKRLIYIRRNICLTSFLELCPQTFKQ